MLVNSSNQRSYGQIRPAKGVTSIFVGFLIRKAVLTSVFSLAGWVELVRHVICAGLARVLCGLGVDRGKTGIKPAPTSGTTATAKARATAKAKYRDSSLRPE